MRDRNRKESERHGERGEGRVLGREKTSKGGKKGHRERERIEGRNT
jgi:hypothetical protein